MLIRLRDSAFLATAVIGWELLPSGDMFIRLLGGGQIYFKSLSEEELAALSWTLNVCFNQQLNALEFYRNRDNQHVPAPVPPLEAEMDQMAAKMARPPAAVPPPPPTLPDPYEAPEPDLSHATVHNELRRLLKREPTEGEMALAMKKLKEFQVTEGGRKA